MRLTVFPFAKALIFSACVALSVPTIAAERIPATDSVQRMPTVTSFAGSLLEEQAVDETGRPEWTGARRFIGTRVYIQKAPWEFGIESRLENLAYFACGHTRAKSALRTQPARSPSART